MLPIANQKFRLFSESLGFESTVHQSKGIGRKFFRGEGGPTEKRTKISKKYRKIANKGRK